MTPERYHMKTKVLFIASSLHMGGSEHVLISILKRVKRQRYEPHLSLLSCEGDLLGAVPQDVDIHPLDSKRARVACWPIARLCWKLRPRVIVSFAAHVNSAVIFAKPALPAGTHILAREGANITLAEIAGAGQRALLRILYPHADLIICQSDDMLQHMTRFLRASPEKFVRIYNPVDAPELRELARGPSPFHGPGPHLVSVGSLYPVKGADLLIRALPSVLRAYPEADLTLVGRGPLESRLRNQAADEGIASAVNFVGMQSNPYPFMRHSDLLVISSRSEALPNVALEALALGTPVVSTDCPGGIREIAQHTKRLSVATGVNSQTLAFAINEKLATISGNLQDRVVEDDFLSEFSPSRIIPMYEDAIERVVAGEPAEKATAAFGL